MAVWFVTGASRGFGAQITKEALAQGHQVVATARNADTVTAAFPDAGDVLALPLDVTNTDQAASAVTAAVDRFGRIDVLVNNAGRGVLGAVEEVSDRAAREVFDTNVFGVLTVTRAVLPVMRKQRSGHVFNISSVGGFTLGPGWGIYGATKFAMEGFSEAMHAELAPLGVRVTIVEPGYFRTDFLDSSSLHTETTVIDDYVATAGVMRQTSVERNHDQPGDPAKAAAAIVKLAAVTNPPLRVQLGADSVARVEAKLQLVQRELDTWRSLSVSTDYDNLDLD
jgi:NAD(P)-dependent dehydrogenase (short-subunit alcohol dehydrogenase family)